MYKKIYIPFWVWYDSFELAPEAYTDKVLAQLEVDRLNDGATQGNWYLEEVELIE